MNTLKKAETTYIVTATQIMARNRSQNDVPKTPLSISESKSQIRFLYSLFVEYKVRLLLSMLVLILISSMSLLLPAFTGKMIDAVLKSTSDGTLEFLVGALIGLLVVQSVMRYFLSVNFSTITETSLARLRERVYGHIVHLPMKFFSEQRVGELASRLSSDLTQIQETLSFTLVELLRQSVLLIGGLVIIFSTSFTLTIPLLVSLPVLLGVGAIFAKKIRSYSKRTQDALAVSAVIVEESLQGITSVKSFVNEHHEVNRYKLALKDQVFLAIKGAKIRYAFVSFVIFAIFGAITGIIWYGGSLVRDNQISIGELTSFLMYAMFVAGALGSFADLISQVQKALGSSVRIREILDQEKEILYTESNSALPQRINEIRFEDVSFSYPSRPEISALEGISLEIQSGKKVAFVGESGAGKSTMFALFQQFYEPTEGKIFYNSYESKELSLADIRKNIGIVPQDILLFGGTIAENIAYGNLSASKEEIKRAAELANAWEFIERFPKRLDEIVGERGIKLSGGQRQRIAIARAIIKNPPILLLDEATSALDSESEQLIQEAIERLMKNRTTVIIAHRLSTIRNCDTIVVFQNGKIVEKGNHEELVQKEDGVYRRLSNLQMIQYTKGNLSE